MHRTAIVMRVDADETLDLQEALPAPAPRASFALRVISGPDAGSVLQLDPSGPPHAVVGQASSCNVQLTDRSISRRHIALTATPDHVLLIDLGSTNGTRVNGVLIREARLYGGETVSIGRTVFRVETDAPNNADLESGVRLPEAEDSNRRDVLQNVIAEQLPLPAARQRVVAEFEKAYIEDLLQRHDGNVTRAARASGVAHRYFQLVRARNR